MHDITELTFAAALLAMSHGQVPATSAHGHALSRPTPAHAGVAHVAPSRTTRPVPKRKSPAAARPVVEASVTPTTSPADPSPR
jgi:hypothetical protein